MCSRWCVSACDGRREKCIGEKRTNVALRSKPKWLHFLSSTRSYLDSARFGVGSTLPVKQVHATAHYLTNHFYSYACLLLIRSTVSEKRKGDIEVNKYIKWFVARRSYILSGVELCGVRNVACPCAVACCSLALGTVFWARIRSRWGRRKEKRIRFEKYKIQRKKKRQMERRRAHIYVVEEVNLLAFEMNSFR